MAAARSARSALVLMVVLLVNRVLDARVDLADVADDAVYAVSLLGIVSALAQALLALARLVLGVVVELLAAIGFRAHDHGVAAAIAVPIEVVAQGFRPVVRAVEDEALDGVDGLQALVLRDAGHGVLRRATDIAVLVKQGVRDVGGGEHGATGEVGALERHGHEVTGGKRARDLAEHLEQPVKALLSKLGGVALGEVLSDLGGEVARACCCHQLLSLNSRTCQNLSEIASAPVMSASILAAMLPSTTLRRNSASARDSWFMV